MTKFLRYGIFGLSAMLLLAGCTKKADEAQTEATTQAEATASEAIEQTFTGDSGTVTLENYKGLELDLSGLKEVTDEDLEAEIENVLLRNPDYIEITERPAQNGDVVNIDYVGLLDGVAFDGGTADGHKLELGSHSFIDGFEDGLVGARKGEERSLNLTFPDPYTNPDLAGKEVVFEVTVNSIEETKIPELDEAFVQRISDFATVDEFRDDLKAQMVSSREQQITAQEDNIKKSMALQAVMEAGVYELNQEAIQTEYDKYYASEESNAAMYGMNLENLVQMQGMTMEQFEARLREETELVIKQQLVVDAICEFEGIDATDETRQKVADSEGMTVEELVTNYGQEQVDEVARIHTVVEFLVANAVVK